MAKITYICNAAPRGFLNGKRYDYSYDRRAEFDDLDEARDCLEAFVLNGTLFYARHCPGFTSPIIDRRSEYEIALHIPGQPEFEVLYTLTAETRSSN